MVMKFKRMITMKKIKRIKTFEEVVKIMKALEVLNMYYLVKKREGYFIIDIKGFSE